MNTHVPNSQHEELAAIVSELTKKWAAQSNTLISEEALQTHASQAATSWETDGLTAANFLTGWDCWNEEQQCLHSAEEADYESMTAETIVKTAQLSYPSGPQQPTTAPTQELTPNFTPYSSGARLEPKPWVTNGITSHDGENPREALFHEYGRVDFDDEEGNTVFSTWLHKTENGYIMRVEEFQDVPLIIETSSELEIRKEAQSTLRAELRQFAESFSHDLHFDDENDPELFSHGHISISPLWDTAEAHQFWVTENYVGTSISDDDDAVPTTWTYDIEYGFGRLPDGTPFTKYSDPVTVEAGNIGEIITAAREWADRIAAEVPVPQPTTLIAVEVVSIAPPQAPEVPQDRTDTLAPGYWESRPSAHTAPGQSTQMNLGM